MNPHLSIHPLVIAGADVRQLGVRHAVLGHLLDVGSYTEISDAAPGKVGLDVLVGSIANSLNTCHVKVCDAVGLEELGRVQSEWEQELAVGLPVCVIVADSAGVSLPLCIFCSYTLPCMDAMPPASVNDLITTCARLAGCASPLGRYLLEESAAKLDPDLEAHLTRRLRQLYGG